MLSEEFQKKLSVKFCRIEIHYYICLMRRKIINAGYKVVNDPVNLHWKNVVDPSRSLGYILYINRNRYGIVLSKFKTEFYINKNGK
jgi:hypothetical protein